MPGLQLCVPKVLPKDAQPQPQGAQQTHTPILIRKHIDVCVAQTSGLVPLVGGAHARFGALLGAPQPGPSLAAAHLFAKVGDLTS